MPHIKDELPLVVENGVEGGEEAEGPDLKFFNDIRVEDPRVCELCNRAGEPGPYHLLLTCLQRYLMRIQQVYTVYIMQNTKVVAIYYKYGMRMFTSEECCDHSVQIYHSCHENSLF